MKIIPKYIEDVPFYILKSSDCVYYNSYIYCSKGHNKNNIIMMRYINLEYYGIRLKKTY